jgi:hypothetical protein
VYFSPLSASVYSYFEEKLHGKITTVLLFLHENIPAHHALATQKKLALLEFQCLDHPHYSPVLARPVEQPPVPWTAKNLKVRFFRLTRNTMLLWRTDL